MNLNKELYLELIEKAKVNERLRFAMDLRTTCEDGSQRMLNALIPGTQVPIHRHTTTAETAIILYGEIDEMYYDVRSTLRQTQDRRSSGTGVIELERHTLKVGDGLQIPAGTFHTIEVKEPSILLEVKDGKYEPVKPEDMILPE